MNIIEIKKDEDRANMCHETRYDELVKHQSEAAIPAVLFISYDYHVRYATMTCG